MKVVLPAALLLALGLAGYAAFGGPGKPPAGPVPWRNTEAIKADAEQIQPRQLGGGVSAPFPLIAGPIKDPLYTEWFVTVPDPTSPTGSRIKKLNDPM